MFFYGHRTSERCEMLYGAASMTAFRCARKKMLGVAARLRWELASPHWLASHVVLAVVGITGTDCKT